MRQILRSFAMAVGLTAASLGSALAEGVSGTINYANGMPIPKGRIFLRVEDTTMSEPAPWTALAHGGPARALAFALDTPARQTAMPTPQVVVRLERPDGWLIARGSAVVKEDGREVRVILYPVAY
ncbi:MAG: hypothetical protein AAF264_06780 [Pseudomonadota bacterium]